MRSNYPAENDVLKIEGWRADLLIDNEQKIVYRTLSNGIDRLFPSNLVRYGAGRSDELTAPSSNPRECSELDRSHVEISH